jgi:hypothetical protein
VVYPVKGGRSAAVWTVGKAAGTVSVVMARAALTSVSDALGVNLLGLGAGVPAGAGIDPGKFQIVGTRPSPGTALTDPGLTADKDVGTLANLRVGLVVASGSGTLVSFSTRERGEGVEDAGSGMREADPVRCFL